MTKFGYFDGESQFNNVSMFLEDVAKKKPKQIVLHWVKPETLKNWDFNLSTPLEHQHLDIATFLGMIQRTAAGLNRLGIQKGDRIILFLPMSVGLYVAMSALQRIGAIPVFLDSWARRNHLGASAQVVSPKGMISFEKAYELIQDIPEFSSMKLKVVAGQHFQSYSATLENLMVTHGSSEITPVEQGHTALITFTTGSSGTPKGANRTHRFLAAQHFALDHSVPYQESDIDLPAFPIFSLNNIASGINTVIPAFDIGVPGEHDALIMLAQFKASGVNCATLSPSLLNRLSAYCLEKNIQLPSMRRMLTGGAPISRDNLVQMKSVAKNSEIWVLYGSTEVEPMAHIEAEKMINFKSRSQNDADYVDEGVNVGHMADGLEYKFLKITDDNIAIQKQSEWSKYEVPQNQVGELIVSGEHVCKHYYNNEDAFKKTKIVDEKGTIWHRTGDLGRLDTEGYLWIVGRVHNAILRGERYVFPVRAEVILKKIPDVKYCAYLGAPHAELGAECIVCVSLHHSVPKEKTEEIKKEIHRLFRINDNLPIDKLLILESIPMDPRHHSKVEYDVLRNQLKASGLI